MVRDYHFLCECSKAWLFIYGYNLRLTKRVSIHIKIIETNTMEITEMQLYPVGLLTFKGPIKNWHKLYVY